MLPKRNRLRKKKDFEKVFKKGRKIYSNEFLFLRALDAHSLGERRFGIVVGKTVSKKAVVRNKLKRRMRHIIKDTIKNGGNGGDIIVIAATGLEKKNFEELKMILLKLFTKANL